MIRLTEAQRRIVPLVAQGLLDKVIAHQLGISTATVKNHISAIFDRLGLSNRVQLAVWYTKWEMEQEVDAKPWHEMTRDERIQRLGFSKPETGDRA